MIQKNNKDVTDKNITMADIIKENGYEDIHIEFADMVMQILANSGNHLGHTVIADLLNVIHFTHLITLFNNNVIKYNSDDPNDNTVMKYSAMFAENIMATKKSLEEEKKDGS